MKPNRQRGTVSGVTGLDQTRAIMGMAVSGETSGDAVSGATFVAVPCFSAKSRLSVESEVAVAEREMMSLNSLKNTEPLAVRWTRTSAPADVLMGLPMMQAWMAEAKDGLCIIPEFEC